MVREKDRQHDRKIQTGFPLMAINDSVSDNAQTSSSKRPYEKPSFRFEQVFVTTALGCGKVSSTDANCIHHQSAS